MAKGTGSTKGLKFQSWESGAFLGAHSERWLSAHISAVYSAWTTRPRSAPFCTKLRQRASISAKEMALTSFSHSFLLSHNHQDGIIASSAALRFTFCSPGHPCKVESGPSFGPAFQRISAVDLVVIFRGMYSTCETVVLFSGCPDFCLCTCVSLLEISNGSGSLLFLLSTAD